MITLIIIVGILFLISIPLIWITHIGKKSDEYIEDIKHRQEDYDETII